MLCVFAFAVTQTCQQESRCINLAAFLNTIISAEAGPWKMASAAFQKYVATKHMRDKTQE